ncbi:MAG: TFIIB-type zinc ribbon-containing protein [Candidatus Bathyarchaeia archaeon]
MMVINVDYSVNQDTVWDTCPICHTSHIIHDYSTGENVCKNCGLVVYSDAFDPGREWSAYDLEESHLKERTGPPMLGKNRELMYTNFSVQKDGRGKPLSVTTQHRMRHLRRQNLMAGTTESETRNLVIAQNLMKKITEKMRLGSSIYEESLFIYKKALARNLVKGKSIECFVAASVLSVIREMNLPRPLEEVAKQANLEPLALSKFYRELVTGLSLKMPVDDPTKYIMKISTKLNFDQSVEKTAIELLKAAREKGLIQGKRPKAIAAAALYLSAKRHNLGITQKELAKSSDVSAVTLRNRIRELKMNSCLPTG